ncbi:MAG: hypothetical protein GY790_10885 [Bacteroidetes bacterium]|nr:hypothetical protein [Bacteroidota bacterium]
MCYNSLSSPYSFLRSMWEPFGSGDYHRFLFCLPSVTGTPGLLKEADVALTRGKTIRIARALLVTAGSEGSDRK